MQVPSRCRLVVVETVYHQAMDGPPYALPGQFTRWLDTDEQPYGPRRFRATSEWAPLDTGWLDKVSMLVVSNEEGKGAVGDVPVPTKGGPTVEVGLAIQLGGGVTHVEPMAEIRPTESFRICPKCALGALRVRSSVGEAKCNVTAFPA